MGSVVVETKKALSLSTDVKDKLMKKCYDSSITYGVLLYDSLITNKKLSEITDKMVKARGRLGDDMSVDGRLML